MQATKNVTPKQSSTKHRGHAGTVHLSRADSPAPDRNGGDPEREDWPAMNPLDYLREAKRGLNSQQEQHCDHLLIGILSVRIPEQQWKDAVQMAVRLARKGKAIALGS